MKGEAPAIVDSEADRLFAERAAAQGHDVEDRFVGGYVQYEWRQSRPLFLALPQGVAGKRVLEFGCHIGASAVVLATLGAEVTAVDVAQADLELARLNARRHGLPDAIRFQHVPDTRRLPYEDASFDLVTCNSVLEYVPPSHLDEVLRQLDRVLRPGGCLLILGTSNRWWPREVHSRRWLINYLPARWRAGRARSVSPLRIKRALPGYRDLGLARTGEALLSAKAEAGLSPAKHRAALWAQAALRPLGISVGMLAHSFMLLLQKPAA